LSVVFGDIDGDDVIDGDDMSLVMPLDALDGITLKFSPCSLVSVDVREHLRTLTGVLYSKTLEAFAFLFILTGALVTSCDNRLPTKT